MNYQRIEYIDFSKGFAIFTIILAHYSQPYCSGIWENGVMLGGTGVHLFFLISGFGLGLSYQNTNAIDFYKKRFSKILIPYYIFIITVYLINTTYKIYPKDGLYALLGHLLLYKMFDETIINSFGYHLWFISTIVQFYIIFPLLIFLKNKID